MAGEECVPQHKLVVCDLIINCVKVKIWKLLPTRNAEQMLESLGAKKKGSKKKRAKLEDKLFCLKECILEASD